MFLYYLTNVLNRVLVQNRGDFACQLALDAVRTVYLDENGRKEIDIKKYAKVEKVPGGEIEDSRVLSGVMLNKDIVHAKMRRRIENPRIILLDGGIEYKKGESQVCTLTLFREIGVSISLYVDGD